MGGFLLNKAEALAKKADEALKHRDEVKATKYLEVAGREYLKREEYWKAQEAFVRLISVWAEAKLIGRILTLSKQIVPLLYCGVNDQTNFNYYTMLIALRGQA